MSKQVSISMLKSEVKMYEEFVDIPITLANGMDASIKLFPYFKPTSIRDLVDDLTGFLQECGKEDFDIPSIEQDDLIGYFIVKHFTDLKFTSSKKVKTIYDEFKVTLNLEIFKILITSFPAESIAKVYERIQEVIDATAQLEDYAKEAEQQFKALPIENKELITKFAKH